MTREGGAPGGVEVEHAQPILALGMSFLLARMASLDVALLLRGSRGNRKSRHLHQHQRQP